MSKIKVPCHNCEQRQVGCHSLCEAYKDYHKENARNNSAIKSAKAKEAGVIDYFIRSINKHKRVKEKTHLGWNTGG